MFNTIIDSITAAEQQIKDAQTTTGRGPGGQELALAATKLREARLLLSDAPITTAFTEPR